MKTLKSMITTLIKSKSTNINLKLELIDFSKLSEKEITEIYNKINDIHTFINKIYNENIH